MFWGNVGNLGNYYPWSLLTESPREGYLAACDMGSFDYVAISLRSSQLRLG